MGCSWPMHNVTYIHTYIHIVILRILNYTTEIYIWNQWERITISYNFTRRHKFSINANINFTICTYVYTFCDVLHYTFCDVLWHQTKHDETRHGETSTRCEHTSLETCCICDWDYMLHPGYSPAYTKKYVSFTGSSCLLIFMLLLHPILWIIGAERVDYYLYFWTPSGNFSENIIKSWPSAKMTNILFPCV